MGSQTVMLGKTTSRFCASLERLSTFHRSTCSPRSLCTFQCRQSPVDMQRQRAGLLSGPCPNFLNSTRLDYMPQQAQTFVPPFRSVCVRGAASEALAPVFEDIQRRDKSVGAQYFAADKRPIILFDGERTPALSKALDFSFCLSFFSLLQAAPLLGGKLVASQLRSLGCGPLLYSVHHNRIKAHRSGVRSVIVNRSEVPEPLGRLVARRTT